MEALATTETQVLDGETRIIISGLRAIVIILCQNCKNAVGAVPQFAGDFGQTYHVSCPRSGNIVPVTSPYQEVCQFVETNQPLDIHFRFNRRSYGGILWSYTSDA